MFTLCLICRSIITIKCAVEAFHAALDNVAALPDTNTECIKYKVEGSASKLQFLLLNYLLFFN